MSCVLGDKLCSSVALQQMLFDFCTHDGTHSRNYLAGGNEKKTVKFKSVFFGQLEDYWMPLTSIFHSFSVNKCSLRQGWCVGLMHWLGFCDMIAYLQNLFN